MIYKNGPRFRIRDLDDIKQDIKEAHQRFGNVFRSIFLPAGNTICMKTKYLCDICCYCHSLFAGLERITVYGSSQYIAMKGVEDLKHIAAAGLTRIHVGLETGDDVTLKRIRKGTTQKQQIQAGKMVIEAGLELSEYVVLGIAGVHRSSEHAFSTAYALNEINPHFIRFRTFVPKIHTPLLEDVKSGAFIMLGPHQVLEETETIIENLDVTSNVTSDHYTNYINLDGELPRDRERFLAILKRFQQRAEEEFRPHFVGTQ
jgi:radical SAM superfamily enzyme YgiQ (UPF0313 family)